MASFMTALWESVFTPGTTPLLIKATHGSFVLLVLSLISLIYISGSIHFVNLLIIALLLWATVTWFVQELAKEKLKSNDDLAADLTELPETKKDK